MEIKLRKSQTYEEYWKHNEYLIFDLGNFN